MGKERLNPDSTKETWFYRLSAEQTLNYQPGDLVALRPANDMAEVRECLGLIGADHFATLADGRNVAEALRDQYDLRQPTTRLYELLDEQPTDNQEDVIDVLVRRQRMLDVEEFIAAFAADAPPSVHDCDESVEDDHALGIVVATITPELAGRKRRGLASTFY